MNGRQPPVGSSPWITCLGCDGTVSLAYTVEHRDASGLVVRLCPSCADVAPTKETP